MLRAAWPFLMLAMVLTSGSAARADNIDVPWSDGASAIEITAEAGNRWNEGAYEVWALQGNCIVRQGQGAARADQAVLWIRRQASADRPQAVIAYLEGNVAIEAAQGRTKSRLTDKSWLGRLSTPRPIDVRAAEVAGQPDPMPDLYRRAMARREDQSKRAVVAAQYLGAAPEVLPSPSPDAFNVPAGTRRMRAFSRSEVPVQAQWFQDPASNQWIALIDSGVNLIVDGLQNFGSIDVSADRLVIWTSNLQDPDLNNQTLQSEGTPLEVYMEGNIVFRQGTRVIYADRMYYDVRNHVGTVINAEMLTPVKNYQGMLRLRTDVLQQTSQDHFFAHNSYFTSSRLGEPRYRVQAGDVEFEDIQRPAVDPWTGQPQVDPQTGEPAVEHRRLASGRNGFLYVGDIPVFYWPWFATDVTEPTMYIRQFQVRHDSVFGTQIFTGWNAFELLEIGRAHV